MPDPAALVPCPVCGRSIPPDPSGAARPHDDPDRPGERCRPPEPPDGTALYWPDGEYSHFAVRSDAHAPTPERRWFQPNNTSMAAATWPDLVDWLGLLDCPVSAAIILRPEVSNA